MFSGHHFIEKELERRIRERNFPAVKSMFKRIAPANHGWRNEKGESFLHIALSVCDVRIFNWLYSKMENNGDVVFGVDSNNRSLIWLAASRINPAFAVSLMARWIGSDKLKSHPNRHVWLNADSHLVSILHLAAADPSSEALEFFLPMLTENAQWAGVMGQQDDQGRSPLHYACKARAFDNIVLLVNAGADLFMLNKKTVYFLGWFEKSHASDEEKFDLFRRLNQPIQFQILSYFRNPNANAEWYAKLVAVRTAQFPEENIEEALNDFDRTRLKSATQVFVEDVQWLQGLIRKVDTLATDLKARPVPNNHRNTGLASFFRRGFLIMGTCTAVMPFVVMIAFAVTVSILAAPLTLGMMIAAVYSTLGVFFILTIGSHLLSKHFGNKQSQVIISHDELADITHELDVGLVQKCKILSGSQRHDGRHLPFSVGRLLLLEGFLERFKSGASTVLQGVVSALDDLQTSLLAFHDGLIEAKIPFSRARIIDAPPPAPALEPEPVLVPKVAVMPSVANHWASLHTVSFEVTADRSPDETLSVSAGVIINK
jgi:ankyrin repeat protein